MISAIHARALPAGIIALGFALMARLMGAVSDGGALAGAVVAFLLMVAAGFGGFLPLLGVFVLTTIATRWRRERKRQLGIGERSSGRTANQVAANLGAASLCALAAIRFPHFSELLMTGLMGALAEAAADTVSSEVGQGASGKAYGVLDFRPVPAGTNGAVSLEGTLAGCAAAFIVAWMGGFFGVVEARWVLVIAIAGVGGMVLDSILGAAFENAGKMGNDAVNFVSTVFAADLALIVALVMRRGGSIG